MSAVQANPYIGPRTFQRDEGGKFFGRDREARDLIALVASEKLVLFYAQSGAGKSSIVNTRLIPSLEDKEYEVLPVGRVGGDVSAGAVVENIFVYNLIRGLVQHKVDEEILAKLSLAQFLAGLNSDAEGYFYDASPLEEAPAPLAEGTTPIRRALIIDQFEELLSTHPEAWEQRDGFFIQLAQAMQEDPYLWVVLVMREDYIAMLDPYAHLLSGGLRVRYYMERLGWEAALSAVKSPVAELRPFALGVAENLVKNLASIKVRKPDGALDIQPGQYVEPVQMQVVCYSLWENLSKGSQITEKDLLEVGDVSESLERYYNQRVSAVAKTKQVPERLIREWFEKELITSSGTRNMVLKDPHNDTGLKDEVIQTLQGDLVRAEMRAGQLWYELSHDRLIEPVRKSNKDWFETNLSVFQRQAGLWVQQGRSEGLLLRGKELEKAEADEKEGKMELTSVERVYLDSSLALRKREERDVRQRRIIRAALVVSVIFLIVAVGFGLRATELQRQANSLYEQAVLAQQNAEEAKANAEEEKANAESAKQDAEASANEAKLQADRALAGNLAAQADSKKGSDHALALLLSMEALEREPNLLTRTTMLELLQFSPYRRLSGIFAGSVSSVAVSPDGIFATASCATYDNTRQCTTGGITLFNANMDQSREVSVETAFGYVYSLAFYEYDDMLVLAAAGCVPGGRGCTDDKGQITLWEINGLNEPKLLANFGREHTARVKTVAFNSDGTLLASGSYDKAIILWDLSIKTAPKMYGQKIEGHSSFVNSVAFSPLLEDKDTLISVGDDRTILRWDISAANNVDKPKLIPTKVTDQESHTAPVNSIAFSPDGKVFATASDDATIILWDSATSQRVRTLEGHSGYIKSIDFNSGGTELASAGFDNQVIVWDVATGDQIGLPLDLHTRAINDVAFGSADGDDFLLSASDDRTVIRWGLTTRKPVSYTVPESPFPEQGGSSVTSGILKATVKDQSIELLNMDTGDSIPLSSHTRKVNYLSFSPDGNLLASASDDQTVILWDMSDADRPEFLKLDGFENPISKVYFSGDGKQLVVIEKNGENTTRWLIDESDWLALACTAINDNILTIDQWDVFSQYLQGSPEETCVTKP